MGKLEGKVAVITGASKGIGEGIAKVYAKYGAKCVLAARGPKVLELAEQLKSEGDSVRLFAAIALHLLLTDSVHWHGQNP